MTPVVMTVLCLSGKAYHTEKKTLQLFTDTKTPIGSDSIAVRPKSQALVMSGSLLCFTSGVQNV